MSTNPADGIPFTEPFEDRPCRHADKPHHHHAGYQYDVSFGPDERTDTTCNYGQLSRCPDRIRVCADLADLKQAAAHDATAGPNPAGSIVPAGPRPRFPIGPSNAEHTAQVLDAMTENVWQSQLIGKRGLAPTYGWHYYHTHDSRRSVAGWPDLVLAKDTRVIFLELKRMRGRVSPAQRQWLERLDAAGLECGIARPDRLNDLVAVLGPQNRLLKYRNGWDK